jgi:hypothetical protein
MRVEGWVHEGDVNFVLLPVLLIVLHRYIVSESKPVMHKHPLWTSRKYSGRFVLSVHDTCIFIWIKQPSVS